MNKTIIVISMLVLCLFIFSSCIQEDKGFCGVEQECEPCPEVNCTEQLAQDSVDVNIDVIEPNGGDSE